MLDAVAESGDPERYVHELLERGERIMGFGHRVYRAEDPRARVLRRTAQELGSPRVEVAEALERAAIAALREKHPERPLETNVEFWGAVVLELAEVPAAVTPALFACARTAGWSAHIVEQRRTGRLIRPSAVYVGPAERSLSSL
jgi:citrate synthase